MTVQTSSKYFWQIVHSREEKYFDNMLKSSKCFETNKHTRIHGIYHKSGGTHTLVVMWAKKGNPCYVTHEIISNTHIDSVSYCQRAGEEEWEKHRTRLKGMYSMRAPICKPTAYYRHTQRRNKFLTSFHIYWYYWDVMWFSREVPILHHAILRYVFSTPFWQCSQRAHTHMYLFWHLFLCRKKVNWIWKSNSVWFFLYICTCMEHIKCLFQFSS